MEEHVDKVTPEVYTADQHMDTPALSWTCWDDQHAIFILVSVNRLKFIRCDIRWISNSQIFCWSWPVNGQMNWQTKLRWWKTARCPFRAKMQATEGYCKKLGKHLWNMMDGWQRQPLRLVLCPFFIWFFFPRDSWHSEKVLVPKMWIISWDTLSYFLLTLTLISYFPEKVL